MVYRLSAADIAEATVWGQGLWRRSQLPHDVGDCTIDRCQLDDGLTLAYARYRPGHDLLERSTLDRAFRCLTIAVALEGDSSTVTADGQRVDFIAGHSTLAVFSSAQGERRFRADRQVRQLRLIASEPLLRRYRLDHLLDGVRPIQAGLQGGATQRLAQTLVHLHGHDAGVLDLQIAALGLLAEQTRALRPPVTRAGKLRDDDRNRMLQARDLMMRQFANPLSVAWLCAKVGTNEFKLKQGFREMFGTSPHRLLTDIRMAKAWELLETGLHVSTVAGRVGYQHASSFSTVFERYYGRTPKSVVPRYRDHG